MQSSRQHHPPHRRELRLVPPRPQPRSTLAYWHLLSLDAPTVAALWTLFIAHSTHTHLPWTSPAAMFVAVWLLYAADRLLDARPGSSDRELEERHRFHNAHRRTFLTTAALASLALVALLHTLPAATLHLYTLLATLLGAWLLLVHARALPAPHRLPKELAVGLFFPAAVFIPTVARGPALRAQLLAPAILFAATCTLNCLFVYAWEHPHDRSFAHVTTRWATRHLRTLTVITICASIALAFALRHDAVFTLPSACAISAAILLVLHRFRAQFRRTDLRALADAALLSPLLLFPFAL